MNKKINFLNIPIDAITMKQTLLKIEGAILNKKQIHHTVVNAIKITKMQSDVKLRESVLSADLINADGQSVVWAAKLFGKNIPERVAGIDLMEHLVVLSFEKGYRCYFLGGTEDVVSKLVSMYEKKYSKDLIAGYRNGFFDQSQENDIVNIIVDSRSNILFIAMTSPKKEVFLNDYKKLLGNVNFIMGVGGSFDVISGKVNRAPLWMRKIGFEWFFRILQEPIRLFSRYLIGTTKFIRLLILEVFNYK